MSTYVVTVQNGSARVYDAQTRAYRGSFGSSVVSAQISGELVQVTKKDGRVEVYDVRTRAYKGGF